MPAILGSVDREPVEIDCYRCKRRSFMRLADLHRKPHLKLEDFKRLGLGSLPTKDMEGMGLSRRQAEDMFRAGFTDKDVVDLGDQGPEAA